jgi:hypothetical protein
MARGNKTYIEQNKFENIAKELGYNILEQAACLKISGPTGNNVYVLKTKDVGRVDISGFKVPEEWGIISLTEYQRIGAVEQQIDFNSSRSEEEILNTFRMVLEHMKTCPEVKRTRRRSAMPGTIQKIEAKQPDKTPDEVAAEKAKRLALIQRVADEKGVQVCAETVAALS